MGRYFGALEVIKLIDNIQLSECFDGPEIRNIYMMYIYIYNFVISICHCQKPTYLIRFGFRQYRDPPIQIWNIIQHTDYLSPVQITVKWTCYLRYVVLLTAMTRLSKYHLSQECYSIPKWLYHKAADNHFYIWHSYNGKSQREFTFKFYKMETFTTYRIHVNMYLINQWLRKPFPAPCI